MGVQNTPHHNALCASYLLKRVLFRLAAVTCTTSRITSEFLSNCFPPCEHSPVCSYDGQQQCKPAGPVN